MNSYRPDTDGIGLRGRILSSTEAHLSLDPPIPAGIDHIDGDPFVAVQLTLGRTALWVPTLGVETDAGRVIEAVLRCEGSEEQVVLPEGIEYQIGREWLGDQFHISLDELSTVSRSHLHLGRRGNMLIARDLSSLNGTTVEGFRLDTPERSSTSCVGYAEDLQVHGDDRFVVDDERGIYGVFDGVSSSEGAYASSVVAEIVSRAPFCQRISLRQTEQELASVLDYTSAVLVNRGIKSETTAIIARCLPVDVRGNTPVAWASIGDSRLYTFDTQTRELTQITIDEGFGRFVTNYIGKKNDITRQPSRVQQTGNLLLQPHQICILVTDGITGDYGTDIMTNDEMVRHLTSCSHPAEIPHALISAARKHDDRTCVVVAPNIK